jgi:FkbM family methyltransferase
MLNIQDDRYSVFAESFCNDFIHSEKPKYIFGRNEFADSIAKYVEIDGFIDDFTVEDKYLGKPIVDIKRVPDSALVVSAVVVGKPIVAEKRMKEFSFSCLDYFAFLKYSGLPIKSIMFWDGFYDDFRINRQEYENVFLKFDDQISKDQFEKLINFRLSMDIDHMRSFKAIEDRQYFEDFLGLNTAGETFVDVGGFDGQTTLEFIKRCPKYKSIYFFEPEEKNIMLAKRRLQGNMNISYYKKGLSNIKKLLRFDASGSSSKISDSGDVTIEVDALDNIVKERVSFIKMDIEGAEYEAIEGCYETISKFKPKLAISAYHKADDLWKIPKQILNINSKYKLFLRHYTEGFAETVIFFIPS